GRALEPGEKLAPEPALADSRVAVDGDERRTPGARGPLERVLEQLELALPADERSREATHGLTEVGDAGHALRRDGLAPAAQLELSRGLELDAAAQQPRGGGADEDLVGRRARLEAGCEVHGLARREGGVAVVRDDLAGLDADPRLETELLDALERRERRAHGALGEDGAYAIGRAYVQQFEPRRIAVGRDMRLSSPQVAAAAIRGAADEGAEVLDLGLVGTEMLYFAVGQLDLDGGIAVTASHN